MSIRVDVGDLNRRLKELSKFMTKVEKRRIAFASAGPLVSAGRKASPVRQHPDKWGHPYENPRYGSKGSKTIRAKYIPGNLKKAFRRIPLQKLRKTSKAFVGPFLTKSVLPVHGASPAKSDGYYAPMAFGKGSNANTYEDKVVKAAVSGGGAKSLLNMQKKYLQVWSKAKTRLKF